MKRLVKTIGILVCVFMLCATSFLSHANESKSISIHYQPGVCRFDFYKICNFSKQTGFSLASPFSEYKEAEKVTEYINAGEAEKLRNLASTLKAIVLRDGLTYSYSASTDSKGNLTLPLQEAGLYLILGEKTQDDQYAYTPAPVLVSVPNETSYDVSLEHSKYDKEDAHKKEVDYKVIKIWKNDDNYAKRPTKISVILLKDGAPHDKVELSVKNNWSYVWKGLEAQHDWTSVEEYVPDGYTMTVENEKDGCVIRNTYQSPPPPPPEELPQTGQLWWPVPVLCLIGVACVVLGVLLKKVKKRCFVILSTLLFVVALGFSIYNIREAKKASDASNHVVSELLPMIEEQQAELPEEEKPTYITHPDMEMPTLLIDGKRYLGYLEIPNLGLVLPIAAGECTQEKLKDTPCFYKGSVYQNNMVIAGHNYARHFSKLRRLDVGTPIKFTDAAGNVFQYKVGWAETIFPTDIERMTVSKGWDLSLFTCTYSGEQRYTLRCILSE